MNEDVKILTSSSSIVSSPWKWVPTLYIAEGLPYFAVNTLTVLMYVKLGIGMAEMAFFTGWLYLPWVIKPFWSPLLDLLSTNRKWIVMMEFLISISMAGVAFFLPFSNFFIFTLICFWLMSFFSATHDIAADGFYIQSLNTHQQASFVGVRSTFYRIASVIGQGGLVMLAGYFETQTENNVLSWSYIFYLLSGFFLIVSFYHYFSLPQAKKEKEKEPQTASSFLKDFIETFVLYFKKKHIWGALLFMLLYRFPEALCIKIVQPFMVAAKDDGGLGMSTTQVGFVNGTIGVIALLAGGIAGGIVISKGGLRKWLWPMAMSLTFPCIFYCFLAMWQPDSSFLISSAVFVEQFGYGFGFSAYMLYLMYFSRGDKSTSFYAFCTAFMALGMMIPGMMAGWIYESLENLNLIGNLTMSGYANFFWLVMCSCIITLLVCKNLHIDGSFGKKSD